MREQNPPPDAQPIEWLLLTTEEVETAPQAAALVDCYSRRGRIEEWHRILKSGCQVEEHQHQTGERLQRAIALDVVLAWRIQLLVLLGRPVPELPCEIFFDNWEVKVLEALQQQKRPDTRGQGGAFRCGGDQILKNSGWNAEVAVDRASAKLQLERFIGGVSRRLEQGRIQSSVETPGHGAISLVRGWPLWCRLNDSLLPYQRVGSFLSTDILLREEDRNLGRDSLPFGRPA